MLLHIASPLYTPLKLGQIRLLYPDTKLPDLARWVLKNADFQDPAGNRTSLQYDALSYCWGDSSSPPTFPISCNGHTFRVHRNLHDALPILASRDSLLPIWIDAICINQNDEAEKIEQLGLMVKIYQRASQVWVWLGPGNQQSVNVIKNLSQLLVGTHKDFSTFATKPKTMSWLNSNEAWASLYDLTDNQWFSRLWVVQEAAFAKEIRVLLGSHEVEWEMLDRLTSTGSYNWHVTDLGDTGPRKTNTWARNIFSVRAITQKAMKAETPLSAREAARIVISTMRSFCANEDDRVFALLGFINIQIPYRMPTEDMYVQLARSIFLNLGPESAHWWAFLRSAASAHKRAGLPSWCPDFHDPTGRTPNDGQVRNHSASVWKNKADRMFSLHSKELVLRGQIFDQIRTVFDGYCEEGGHMYEVISGLHSWEEKLESAVSTECAQVTLTDPTAYRDELAVRDAYWTTLNSYFAASTKPMPLTYKSLESFRHGKHQCLELLETLE